MLVADIYNYAVIRVVPRVERGEFINAGIILSCQAAKVLMACVELDEARLLALDASADLEVIHRHLGSFSSICAADPSSGPIGQLPQRARFHWMTARRSSIIQTSPVHSGRCHDPATAMDHLMARMVRPL